MPLNYSKWDMLELSDDSDIEEHPNVDKKSMIRWKQRDIHEKREARRINILKLRSELALNSVLRPRIQAVASGLSSGGVSHYRAVQRRLKEQPSPEKPNTGAPSQPTYDMMLAQLLSDTWREAAWVVDGAKAEGGVVKKDGKKVEESTGQPKWADEHLPPDGKAEKMGSVLSDRLDWHLKELSKRDKEVEQEIEKEEAEQKKKITSEDITEGFSATSVVKGAAPSPIENKGFKEPKKTKKKEQVIEVLNQGASLSVVDDSDKEDSDTEDLPDFGPLTPIQRAFSQIPIGEFERSYLYIQKDSSVLTEQTHDSLLAEAFDAEKRGEKKLAKQCIHQALLVDYCRKLGRDGVGLFFQRMIQRNPKSIQMFNQDVETTYARVATRTVEMAAESEGPDGEREQIQLVAEDPNIEISFNLPDGPPPETIRIEGEGAEQMDMEEVRAFLQRKWEIFEGFPEKMKAALKSEKLAVVNKALGAMKLAEAEEVVGLLQEGGMLSFSEKGVRDMTK